MWGGTESVGVPLNGRRGKWIASVGYGINQDCWLVGGSECESNESRKAAAAEDEMPTTMAGQKKETRDPPIPESALGRIR